MFLERFIVIIAVIAEDPSASIEHAAIAHQAVPVVMPNFVPKVPEQRAIWLCIALRRLSRSTSSPPQARS
jgi:hypothetical protein